MFMGSIVALITPFTADGLDEKALANLVRYHIDNGTNALVPVGTTGESPTVTKQEHKRTVQVVVGEVAGQIPVIAGAGSNSTQEAVEYHRMALELGADGALHAMGYYNRPSQEGVYQHFQAVDASADLPIVVYNIPPRCVVDIEPTTMARLARLNNVVGVKDATRDLSRPLVENQLITKPFAFLSGEDPTAVAYNAQGGHGCISVVANVVPALVRDLQNLCRSGDFCAALKVQRKLLPLQQALTMEPSPAGVKYACSLLGLCASRCRLPIVELNLNTKSAIKQAMQTLALI